jgi:hypothetical protein
VVNTRLAVHGERGQRQYTQIDRAVEVIEDVDLAPLDTGHRFSRRLERRRRPAHLAQPGVKNSSIFMCAPPQS